MDTFKAGDKVWSLTDGWGKVKSVDSNYISPVRVKFEEVGFIRPFSLDGVEAGLRMRTLFFQEIEIPKEALIRPRWRAKIEDCYIVVSSIGRVETHQEFGQISDDKRYESGNYFQTEELARDSKFYKVFHEEN